VQESKLIDHISNWIADYVKEHGLKAMVVPYDDSYPAVLTTHLCVRARIKSDARVICVTDKSLEKLFPTVTSISGSGSAHIAEIHNGVVIGDITRTESLARRYHKYYHAADLYPLYGLLESQVEQLVRHEVPVAECEPCKDRDQAEWVIKENDRSGIITSDKQPQQNRYWFAYTTDQKQLIAQAYDRQKRTRHKSLDNALICPIPTLLLS
jgi:hypothetical protein